MKVGKIPAEMDPIDAKKKVGSFLKLVQNDSKPNKCILCGQPKTSFCNSHSVPRMCLKNIAVDGKVLQANGLVGADIIDVEKGINNSGTFHFICNECDSKVFQDYENPDAWTDVAPTDRVLAQIALKDVLLMLSKRNMETLLWQRAAEMSNIGGMDYMRTVQELDIRDFTEEMELYKGITAETNKQFKVVFYEKLPYTVPIATQVALVLDKDFEGNEINEIFNISEDVRIQNLHISIFPLEDDEKLQMLSQENYGVPNLGYVLGLEDLLYEEVKPSEITNLLFYKKGNS